jgi:iron complex outermembrane recepter protein
VVQPQPQTGDASQPGAVSGVAGEAAGGVVGGSVLKADIPVTNNVADMLTSVPGVNVYTGGGVSDLPVIHGMNDDRVNTTINGMAIAAACGNHMNPPLSYVDPSGVKKIDVIAGMSPVSAGGDSLGGVIAVERVTPAFAPGKDEIVTHGSVSAYVRSASQGVGGAATASVATSNFSAVYTGAWSQANDYVDGHGDRVDSTYYQAQNHNVTFAFRGTSDVLTIDTGVQQIPYQGFVNQWMDMTDNHAWYINGRYDKKFDWGKLFTQLYYQSTLHEMDMLQDKNTGRYNYPVQPPRYMTTYAMPWMPMHTAGTNLGYTVKGEIPLNKADTLRVGTDLQRFTLDDWWPPVGNPVTGVWTNTMMCCNTFQNINGGERTRVGTFAELETKWAYHLTTLVGVRNDVVNMDTGNVQGYNTLPAFLYVQDATAFNAQKHEKTDVNFDVTALVRYEPTQTATYESGYARKTRSPNLYERYTWASLNSMAALMNGWFGDGNGYVGDINLKPEVANTASFTAGWSDHTKKDWLFKVTPYYTYVEDYINVDTVRPNCPTRSLTATSCQFLPVSNGYGSILRFANHDAEMYGVDVGGSKFLWESPDFGRFNLAGTFGYVQGQTITGDSLYHMMPINSNLALQQKWGKWTNSLEVQMVNEKDIVDPIRKELPTGGYGIFNLRSSYEVGPVRLDFGVENIFNLYYEPPLGGVDIGMQPLLYPATLPVHAVPGMGRNFYAGLTAKF